MVHDKWQRMKFTSLSRDSLIDGKRFVQPRGCLCETHSIADSRILGQNASAGLFVSAKTANAIPIRCALIEDALVRASLDPAIRTIELVPHQPPLSSSPEGPAIVVVRDDGRFRLRVQTVTACSADAVVLSVFRTSASQHPEIVLTEADLHSEPRSSNERLVWSQRRRRVSAGLRFQIPQTLRENGPMTLGELMSAVRILGDSRAAVLSLACADLVELDLGVTPLGPATVARHRA
jgi:hypothetical protein